MDFNQLKELARKLGGILVMNGNEPEFVILTFGDFERLQSGKTNNTLIADELARSDSEDESAAIEKLNKEILVLKEEIRLKEEAELVEEEDEKEKEAEIDEIGVKTEE